MTTATSPRPVRRGDARAARLRADAFRCERLAVEYELLVREGHEERRVVAEIAREHADAAWAALWAHIDRQGAPDAEA